MAYKLKNGVFAVRCRHEGCPFNTRITITQNLMGMTEQDVEIEAKKLARDMGRNKHDAVYGKTHTLESPEIHKVAGVYQTFGASGGHG
jgi:hypothetical protein